MQYSIQRKAEGFFLENFIIVIIIDSGITLIKRVEYLNKYQASLYTGSWKSKNKKI